MPQIAHVSPGWLSTFPHVTVPLPDEWIAGMLLRCDEMNQRTSGTTWRYLLRSTTHPGFGPGSPFIVVPEAILELLSHLLLIEASRLLATTYAGELARLYAPAHPHAEQLLGHRRGVTIPLLLTKSTGNRANATVVGFRICPICVAQARLLKRTTLLPHLKYCPTHHVAFHTHCPCSSPLILFCRGKPPFRCFRCGLDWAQFPHLRPSPDEVELEGALLTLYELFLVQGTPELMVSALSLLRQYLKKERPLTLKLASGRTLLSLPTNLYQHSLGYIINLLVSLDISPEEIRNKQTL